MQIQRKSTHHLYFAYGADMNDERIRKLCPRAKRITLAKLPDHGLAFFGYARKWDSAQETLVEKPGEDLWGVVYELSFSDVDQLDVSQNVRLDGTGAYFHFPAEVLDDAGNSYDVILYKKNLQGEPTLPSEEYLDYVVAGAVLQGVPSVYIDKLSGITSQKAGYRVPLKSRIDMPIVIDHSCNSCGA